MSYHNGSNRVSLKAIVNLASFTNLDVALNLKYLKIVPDQILSYGVLQDSFTIGAIRIIRNWQDGGLYDCQSSSPGYWTDAYFNSGGDDVVSLKLHLMKSLSLQRSNPFNDRSFEFLKEAAAQFQPEATEQAVVDDLAQRLGINVLQPAIRQPAAFRGWSQVDWISPSSPQFGKHPEEDDTRRWPKYRPDRVPFIGQPISKFEIRDAMGRLQQVIGYWATALGGPLILSFTPWHKDHDPLYQRWKFARSALRTCPYGLTSALENKNATIVIDDDLRTVNRENAQLLKHHGTATPIVFVAWPKGLYGASPAGINWSNLRDRKVIASVGNDRDSFAHAFALNEELANVGVESLEFVLPKTCMGGQDEITVDIKGGELRGIRKEAFELAEIAKQKFGIFSKFMQTTALSPVWKIGDGSASSAADLIMTPWLEKATINLLYSEAGVGKSWFALLILYALVTGGKAFGRFQAQRRYRCLYLAGETVSRICKRIEDIHAAMPGCDGAYKIDVYPRPGQKDGKLNLEREEDWLRFRALSNDYDVIVIDHLSAFTSGRNSVEIWSRLHLLLRQLTEQGKTILLLHHAGKNGQQRGTSLLDADVDTKIQLTSLDDATNGLLVKFEKHRDDETLGQALQPFEIRWDKGPDGLLRWATIDADASNTKTWVPLPETDNDPARSVDEAFILASFEGREAEIILCLATALLRGSAWLRRREIDDQIGASGSTTRSVIDDLVAKGTVLVEGHGKATKYGLSEEMMRSVIRK